MAFRFGLRSKLLLALIGTTLLIVPLAGLIDWQILDGLRSRMSDEHLWKAGHLNAMYAEAVVERDLTLARQMAQSTTVAAWLASENDGKLRAAALARADEFRQDFRGHLLFMTPAQSGNYYFEDDQQSFSQAQRHHLDPDAAADRWFYQLLRQADGYTIGVRHDPHSGMTKMWLNVVVRQADGRPLGVVGTGIDPHELVDQMPLSVVEAGADDTVDESPDGLVVHHEPGLTPIMVDSEGRIQIQDERTQAAPSLGGKAKANLFDLLGGSEDVARIRAAMARARANPGEVELFPAWLAGRAQRVALVWLPSLHWYALTAMDIGSSRILDNNAVLRLALPTLGVFFLAALLFLIAVGMLVTRRLEALGKAAAASFKEGEIDAAGLARVKRFAVDYPGDQIGQLGATLGNVLDEIGRHQKSLRVTGLVIEHSQSAVIILDNDRHIIQVNPAAVGLYGYAAAELLGDNLGKLRHPLQSADFYERAWNQVASTGSWQGEAMALRKDKGPFAVWHQITALKDGDGRISHFVFISTDLSERKAIESRLHDLTYFDSLTKLPNRMMFLEHLAGVMETREDRQALSVIVLDIDRFRVINDAVGARRGDGLLQAFAKRLSAAKAEVEVVARLSIDQFAVLLPRSGADQAAWRTRQLLETLCGIYSLERGDVSTTLAATAGVSVFPDDAEAADALLDQATTAARFAKDAGERGGLRFFTREMNAHIHERLALEAELRKALADGDQLFLVYQPQVDLDNHRIVGAEALIRWKHPQRGIIPPVLFIPIAEESGLILEVGAWVVREAVRQGACWQQAGLDLRVAVNLSARQFSQSSLPGQIRAILDETRLAPHLLELEITETSLMNDVDQATAHLENLSRLGVQIALDDFGTGYSSLSYVQRFVLHRLKIDQSFVRDLGISSATAIVNTIIDLARNLGLKVIAEGVETPEQLNHLVAMKCDEYQGYHCSHPVLASEIPDIIADWEYARAALSHLPAGENPAPDDPAGPEE
jgi:diguanylate cyclase (GGDEF)-like protein/PAS domain S-box-containing protein